MLNRTALIANLTDERLPLSPLNLSVQVRRLLGKCLREFQTPSGNENQQTALSKQAENYGRSTFQANSPSHLVRKNGTILKSEYYKG